MKKNKNSGFSLIEMIVVLAIMAVMMVAIGFSISMIGHTRAKACAADLESAIESTRIQAMSLGEGVSLRVYRGTDNKIYVDQTLPGSVATEEIGGSAVTVTADGKVLGSADLPEITISFKASSGAFIENPEIIIVSNATKAYTMKLHKLTGKVERK